ncbi:MAG: hypothetical protein LUH43_00585 [Clostridia bacterium]|nr:hypothetical protein [Clostridia bacterium]
MICETVISRDDFGNIVSRLIIKMSESLSENAFVVRHTVAVREFYETKFQAAAKESLTPARLPSRRADAKTLAVYYSRGAPSEGKRQKYALVCVEVAVFDGGKRIFYECEIHRFRADDESIYMGEAKSGSKSDKKTLKINGAITKIKQGLRRRGSLK